MLKAPPPAKRVKFLCFVNDCVQDFDDVIHVLRDTWKTIWRYFSWKPSDPLFTDIHVFLVLVRISCVVASVKALYDCVLYSIFT